MNRIDLENYILETYNVEADHPWLNYPCYEVFRHVDNKKWFALIMCVSKNKLGLNGDELLDIVNVKSNPLFIESLCEESGIFKAYHMNKNNWITIALDGSVHDEKIKTMLDMSYMSTI